MINLQKTFDKQLRLKQNKEKKREEEYKNSVLEWERNKIPQEEPVQEENVSLSPLKQGRRGNIAHSDEDLDQIVLLLLQREREDPKTKWKACTAEIPLMKKTSLDLVFREAVFINENAQIPHKEAEEEIRLQNDRALLWKNEDKLLFQEKMLLYGKDFRRIASHFPKKKVSECVLFYYLNKKSLKLRRKDKKKVS